MAKKTKFVRPAAKTAARSVRGRPTRKSAGKSAKASKPAARKTRPAKPPKCPLSKKELAHYRHLLLEKRRALVGDLNGIQSEAFGPGRNNGGGDLSNMPTHPADVGTDNYEQEFTLGLLESERILLAEIDDALARIDKGTYGICMGTGNPIGKQRLDAKPWAKYGIEYARLIEKGLVRAGEDDAFARDDDEASDEDEDEVAEEDDEVFEDESEDLEEPEAPDVDDEPDSED